MLYIHIHEYPIYSIGYGYIHISIYNIDIHVTSGHIFSGKYGHTCTPVQKEEKRSSCWDVAPPLSPTLSGPSYENLFDGQKTLG